MATKFEGSKGSYDKNVPDSGDGQDKKKFTKSVNQPTDNMKKPTDKGNPGSVKYSGNGDQHSNP